MDKLRKIVVGVDLDSSGQLPPGSLRALRHACWFGGRTDAQLTLIHSPQVDERWHTGRGYEIHHGPSHPEACLRRAVAEIVKEQGAAGQEPVVVISEENAWLAITKYVLRDESDLVLVGKRSDPGAEGPLLGSVSAKLLRSCPCAVWVLKPGSPLELKTIVGATDLSPVGDRVLELVGSIGAEFGSSVHVVHALQMPITVQLEGEEAQAEWLTEVREDACQKIRASLAPYALAAPPELHVALTSPTRAVTECDGRLSPDLVVMGTISRGGVRGVLVGNTAERLLARIDSALLTVKPADFACSVSLDPSLDTGR